MRWLAGAVPLALTGCVVSEDFASATPDYTLAPFSPDVAADVDGQCQPSPPGLATITRAAGEPAGSCGLGWIPVTKQVYGCCTAANPSKELGDFIEVVVAPGTGDQGAFALFMSPSNGYNVKINGATAANPPELNVMDSSDAMTFRVEWVMPLAFDVVPDQVGRCAITQHDPTLMPQFHPWLGKAIDDPTHWASCRFQAP